MFESLQKILESYFKDQPVNRAFLFGSVVRNDHSAKSDLDILVELNYEAGAGYSAFFSMQQELSKILDRKVDLVSANGLSPYIKPIIDREKKLVYERN